MIWGKKNPRDEIPLEVLLCRGFIPEVLENLSDGLSVNSSSPLDKEYLIKRYKIDTLSSPSEASIKSIISDIHSDKRFACGFTGPNDFSGALTENFFTFKRCKFGVRVPVEFLDPGIALLVKTLPLIGVMTAMSCGGHFESDPYIVIRNKYHLDWAQNVFTYIFEDMEGVSFLKEDNSWLGCKIVFETTKNDESSYFKAYWQAQTMARFLLDGDNSNKIRESKALLENENQLTDEKSVHSILKLSGVKAFKNA